jgi:hypothetical protein
VEDFNAKAQRRKDAKKKLALPSSFASLRLCVFALNSDCMVTDKTLIAALILMFSLAVSRGAAGVEGIGPPLRVASITPAAEQPAQHDPAVIFYDDFASAPQVGGARYLEYDTAHDGFVWSPDGGLRGGAMRCQFAKGQVTAGGLKVLFGRNPLGRGIRREETFNEIYWRLYVKHEKGWEGNPAKLARATCLAGEDWSQGLIAHVWGGKGDVLCIDPATGIRDGVKTTVHYNDFDHLKWLGLRNGQTPIFSPAESGRWVCVESHVKLNRSRQSDGVFELWVDGKLEASRTNLDWHGTWNAYAINAVFLENYWNTGSLKRQARWFDDFVISTRAIGPILATTPPVITRTSGDAEAGWEVELAADPRGDDVVWRSKLLPADTVSLTVDSAGGNFSGSRADKSDLAAGQVYWTRIRSRGDLEWSPWHAPFRQ